MDKYPFIRCLNPRRIINPYTRESIIVECGSCPACTLRKSSVAAMKVKLESLSNKFNMFITLTYNNIFLPRMLLKACNRYKDDVGEVQDNREPFSLIDITSRLGTEGTVLGYSPDFYHITEIISKKVELPKGFLPHLSKYDAQLFIKRLRRNIEKYFKDEEPPKIRYYLVGEYGPIHFRPHYHISLWFQDERLFKVIRQIIHKSWPYGRIDCQKSLGKCADYVAKYLNSSVSLPEVFKLPSVRPFSIHSTHLGEKIFEATREEIYTSSYQDVIARRIPDFATDRDVIMWRSLKTYFFPKCKGFINKSEQERLFSYSTYVKAYRWLGETNVASQARTIVTILLYRFYHVDLADDMYYYDDSLLDYFECSSMFNPWNFENKTFSEHIDDVYRRIYMELRLSKHFHRFVCKGFINLYKPMLDKITHFWQEADLYNLNNQLSVQVEFSESDWFEPDNGFDWFYHNKGFDIERFKLSKVFNTFNEVTSHNALNAVKHKRLNDANKIFL